MEIIISLLLNPVTIVVVGFIVALGFIASPYEIHFEDKEEIEI